MIREVLAAETRVHKWSKGADKTEHLAAVKPKDSQDFSGTDSIIF